MTSISEEFYLLSTFQKSGDISGLTKYAKFPEPQCCCKRDTMRRACVRILHSIVCAARITFFHAAASSTSRLRKRVGGMSDRQTKALNLRFARGETHERSRIAGLRRRLSCGGVPAGL
jgi:hypothetical protein